MQIYFSLAINLQLLADVARKIGRNKPFFADKNWFKFPKFSATQGTPNTRS